MITVETLHIQTPSRELYLAPYGISELEKHLPLDPRLIPYETESGKQYYANSAANVVEDENDSYGVTSWGIYSEKPSDKSFVGVCSLSQLNMGTSGDLKYNRNVQELGVAVFDPCNRSKGLGQLAALAMVLHAREAEEAHVFMALTSEHNKACKSGLDKLGFVSIGYYYREPLKMQEKTEYWVLADQQGREDLSIAGFSDAEYVLLVFGWERHKKAIKDVTVKAI